MLRQFCSPIFDLDNMTKSSAYKSEFNFAPFGRTKGSDRIFSRENGISFIKGLNRNGLKIQPYQSLLLIIFEIPIFWCLLFVD